MEENIPGKEDEEQSSTEDMEELDKLMKKQPMGNIPWLMLPCVMCQNYEQEHDLFTGITF